MAFVLADRVKETTSTAGTGTITLLGASTGYQSFSAIGNGNTTFYCIAGQGTSEWEVGIGTYTSSGTTLSRDTVLASSAGGTTKVTFSAGTKDVFVTYPAERSVYSTVPTNGQLLIGNGTDYSVANLTAGSNITITNSAGGITISASSSGGSSAGSTIYLSNYFGGFQ